ncbi:MAG: hypothetical protein LBK99_10990 [Opitutaceae bacterium]|nr:hypothetical protein [Opitutaceae bacterium]
MIALLASVTGKQLPASAATSGADAASRLDPDQNGLYDDTERKILLDTLLAAFPGPEPLAAPLPFDSDGDGKVTILEQSKGRHPLTQLISAQRFGETNLRIPWGIDIFPEWISTAWFQEDTREGPLSGHTSRGAIQAVATQTSDALKPRRAGNREGIVFDENSGRHFSIPGQRDARWNYRWGVFTFRIDAASGSGGETLLLDLNRDPENNAGSFIRIWHDKRTGLNIRYTGKNKGGRDHRHVSTTNIVADGRGWNVAVFGIRYGQLFVSVNGESLVTGIPQPPRFSSDIMPERAPGVTFLGDTRATNEQWACDALVFGLTEPSEATVRKLTGWAAHRLGFPKQLPAAHPYRDARPVVDAEDFPYRYFHDDGKWTAWGESLSKTVTRVNAGGPRVEPQGFERVFIDDFRASRVTDSTSGEGDLWHGPGFITAVGGSAPLVTPGREPDTYEYDAKNRRQILSLKKQGDRWRGSAIYTVNDLGHGYTWKGPKIFRIRCLFPKEKPEELAGGLFPAFWSYDPDFLFWRTANRIEVDWWEFDGKGGGWLNGLSSHVHYSHLRKNIFAKNPERYKSYKGYGGLLTEEKSGIPGGLYMWDGQFHTWEFVVDADMTCANVTIPDANGAEKWVEIYRLPTAPIYLERLDLQVDYALKAKNGLPKKDRQDLVIDWIEVWQKQSALELVPEPFIAKPRLTGANQPGGTVTCEPNLKNITDIRYYWFADDYPLTWGPSPSWTITAAEAGKTIRCMVKAVGARDMPEAWSNALPSTPLPSPANQTQKSP